MEMKTLKEREKEHLQKVLELTHWDLEKASRLLEVPLKQVKRKIREHGIVTEEPGIDN
jgi:transcriptional regulator with GAF, ATPase, and Fis domain